MIRIKSTHLIAMVIIALCQEAGAGDATLDVATAHVPITESTLDSVRGLGDAGFIQLNDVDLQATLSGNVIHSSVTGNNTISNSAFANMEGFATVIQNSGNHVILQNSTIVNFMLSE